MAAPEPAFRGRARERQKLDQLLQRVRAGESAVLVIRGEAGIGKTALMRYCAREASRCRVVQLAGVESELELPYAAVQQLCRPIFTHLPALPEPQQRALQIAFGLTSGNAPDRFVVGLAVLSLLADAAADQPLVCLIDDAQWLDDASAQVLGFVGRRLHAESVLLLFAVREADDRRRFSDLSEVTVEGLPDADARALLAATVAGPLDRQVRDRIVAETRGNPLGLLELPRGMTPAELAGGFGWPTAASVPGRVEERYRRRIETLPDDTRQLMLLAAADPTGDATLLWRAAYAIEIGRDAAEAAAAEQLLTVGASVRFRHPLVRSAAYAVATDEDRAAAHLALAEATDPETDPERRVWHRGVATADPDEEVAAELGRSASRVQARAGMAAAATFLQRAVEPTTDPTQRADRALAAAQTQFYAGAFDRARSLLAEVEASSVDDLRGARAEQLRAQIQWAARAGREAPVLLRRAAERLEHLDLPLARETYLHVWIAAAVAGPLVDPGGQLVDISQRARAAPAAAEPLRPCDLLLDGLAALVLDGRARAEPGLRRAVAAFVSDTVSVDDWLQWGVLARVASIALWDFDTYRALSGRLVEVARASGALAPLSMALSGHGAVLTWCGDLEAATALSEERQAVAAATGTQLATAHDLMLAGYRGRPDQVLDLVSAAIADGTARGEGWVVHLAEWSKAILNNGLGRHEDAMAAAEAASAEAYMPAGVQVALPELIEAASRTGEWALAAEAMERLSVMTINGSDWAAGYEARCRALVSEPPEAEGWYTEAIDRLGRTPLRPDLARAQLLYGEWLHHENRRVDARQQLRLAHEAFTAMGADGFAERARRELAATGEKVQRRSPGRPSSLTAQEEHIARLARDGRTNNEVAAEVFLSVRTVEWHLRKVFTKLGITSRRELKDALPPSNR